MSNHREAQSTPSTPKYTQFFNHKETQRAQRNTKKRRVVEALSRRNRRRRKSQSTKKSTPKYTQFFNHKETNMYVVNYFLGRDDLLTR
ncbi:MAG: hypothetical protein ACI4RT_07740, partial [Candidatus Spyradenecus sp.]